MINTSRFRTTSSASVPHVGGRTRARAMAAAVTAAAIVVAALHPVISAAAPAAGDTYVYRYTDGYTKQLRGQISYRVDSADANRVVEAVTADTPSAGTARTDIYTTDGNWLRHPLVNHDQPVEYEFATAYPAYLFPLETGKSWSVRIDAVNPASGRRNSVRVDGEVLGTERISVPAGDFDTIKVRRLVYAGDWDGFRRETNIIETDWYAPAVGRAIRSVTTSHYLDLSRIRCCVRMDGDWNVYELVFLPAPARK